MAHRHGRGSARLALGQRPQLTRAAVDLGEELQRLERALRRERAQEGGRVVDEDRGALALRQRRERVALPGEPGARHLGGEHQAVARAEQRVRGEQRRLLVVRLRLHHQPHERDRVLALRRGPQPRLCVAPALDQIVLEDGHLALVRQLVDDTEGGDEGGEHWVRELEHELLHALERRRHRARQVGEPVHKVKRLRRGHGHTVTGTRSRARRTQAGAGG